MRSDEAGPASKQHKNLDYLLADKEMKPVKVHDPKNTVAYLGYSSGTSGKAKGVRTSAYNMTVRSSSPYRDAAPRAQADLDLVSRAQSVLSILAPVKTYEDDVQLAVLPLNRASCSLFRSYMLYERRDAETGDAVEQLLTSAFFSTSPADIYGLTKVRSSLSPLSPAGMLSES